MARSGLGGLNGPRLLLIIVAGDDIVGTSGSIIEADRISKAYGSQVALEEVSLEVGTGELLALVGPSGCGKTTLLKIIAGFEEPTSGSLRIDNREMQGIPAAARPTRMVFQNLALFPHKTVGDNISFPLKIAGVERAGMRERLHEMLDLMSLSHAYVDRFPDQLSGGEQQRVALARAMISRPKVLLLDEPLSALDAKLKKSLQAEIKRLHRSLGTSFVHVTHDLEEAMMLADRICVMNDGGVVQVGTPAEIYYEPSDSFVAGFIGETNFLPIDLASEGRDFTFSSPVLGCSSAHITNGQVAADVEAGPSRLMVRPESIRFVNDRETPPDCGIAGTVEEFFVKGSSIQYRITVEGLVEPLVMEVGGTAEPPARVGEAVRVGFDCRDGRVLAS